MSHEPGHSSARDMIDAGPPGSPGGPSSGPSPIGVPEGYRAPVRRYDPLIARYGTSGSGYTTTEAAPRYMSGDEWKPASLSPQQIAQLQREMIAVGLIGPRTTVRNGVWDEPTREAYKELLGFANSIGTNAETALRRYRGHQIDPETGEVTGAMGGTVGGGTLAGDVDVTERFTPGPLPLETTNPADLRRIFRHAVIDTLGEGWSREKIDELVRAYNWEEIRLQVDAYQSMIDEDRRQFEAEQRDLKQLEAAEAMAARGEDAEVTVGDEYTPGQTLEVSIPSPQAFLEERMIEDDPVGYGSGRIVNEMIPAFMDMLGGWGR